MKIRSIKRIGENIYRINYLSSPFLGLYKAYKESDIYIWLGTFYFVSSGKRLSISDAAVLNMINHLNGDETLYIK